MAFRRPRFRLRSLWTATLIPLTVLPLLIMAALTQLFVQRSLRDELTRRARPELATFIRGVETIERRLQRQTLLASRNDQVKLAALTRNREQTEEVLRPWLEGSGFDYLRVYDFRGVFVSELQRKDTESLGVWEQVFSLANSKTGRNPSSEGSARPSAQAQSVLFVNLPARFDKSRRYGNLKKNFRNFLRSENSWSIREVSEDFSEKGNPLLVISAYRAIFDSDYRPAGFLEGVIKLNPVKIAQMASFQGIELSLHTPQGNSLGSSGEHFEESLKDALKDLRPGSNLTESVSKEIEVGEELLEFYFSPLGNDFTDAVAWMGVGLSKSALLGLQKKILYWVTGIAILLSLFVIYLTVVLSDRITRPLHRLVEAAEGLRTGENVKPITVENSSEEMAILTERFNEMAMSVHAAKRTLEVKLEELAESHEALKQMQGQLVQSAKMSSLGQLVAGVAHELNNPIAYIYSNMVQMKGYLKGFEKLDSFFNEKRFYMKDEIREELQKVLDEMEWTFIKSDMPDIVQSCLEGSIRVKDIVLGLRNFSRLDKGEFQENDINDALTNTTKLLSGQLKNKVRVDWELCESSQVRCNLSQINQVFMNIIANAAQAIEESGEIFIKTQWIEKRGEEYLRISIRDNGKGIRDEYLDRIFDPFFTTKSVGDGTGLGLSIVYGIVEKHEGEIAVRSVCYPEPMHGTNFHIDLPKRGPRQVSDVAADGQNKAVS